MNCKILICFVALAATAYSAAITGTATFTATFVPDFGSYTSLQNAATSPIIAKLTDLANKLRELAQRQQETASRDAILKVAAAIDQLTALLKAAQDLRSQLQSALQSNANQEFLAGWSKYVQVQEAIAKISSAVLSILFTAKVNASVPSILVIEAQGSLAIVVSLIPQLSAYGGRVIVIVAGVTSYDASNATAAWKNLDQVIVSIKPTVDQLNNVEAVKGSPASAGDLTAVDASQLDGITVLVAGLPILGPIIQALLGGILTGAVGGLKLDAVTSLTGSLGVGSLPTDTLLAGLPLNGLNLDSLPTGALLANLPLKSVSGLLNIGG